jgi:hypothetical protein
MIANILCQDVQAWLIEDQRPWESFQPDTELVNHVSTCPSCRARLMLLLQDLLGVPFEIESDELQTCSEDLLSYIDVEQDQGREAAIKLFPQVWWHLWQCEACSESYEEIVGLVEDHGNMFADIVLKPQQALEQEESAQDATSTESEAQER